MSIRQVHRTFNKGLAIIVGKKNILGRICTDAISLHTVYCLGNRIEFLDIANILPEDKQIYLIGHGHPKKLTVGGRNMHNIAKLLIKAGYDGSQRIHVTSCYAALQRGKTSVVSELKRELKQQLSGKGEPYNLIIESDADGAAVYIENNPTVQMWILISEVTKISCSDIQKIYIFVHKYTFKFRPPLINKNEKIKHIEDRANTCIKEWRNRINNYKRALLVLNEE